MTPEEKKAEVAVRVQRALGHIQNAQTELGRAAAELSCFLRGAPEWKRASKLYEMVHAFWYRVRDRADRYQLDGITEQAIERRHKERQEAPGYPPGWRRCPACGLPALDGHITCGSYGCNESGRRNGGGA